MRRSRRIHRDEYPGRVQCGVRAQGRDVRQRDAVERRLASRFGKV